MQNQSNATPSIEGKIKVLVLPSDATGVGSEPHSRKGVGKI